MKGRATFLCGHRFWNWYRFRAVLAVSLGWVCALYGQAQRPKTPEVPRHEAAELFFAQGEAHLRAKHYSDAAVAFENVVLQPYNQRTSAGLYLAGLAYTYQRDYEKAISRFQELLTRFPASRYAESAQYHKAVILLRRSGSEAGGLYVLLNLIEQTSDASLKADAEELLRKFYFDTASIDFLKDYVARVRPSYRAYTLEALCYRLHRDERRAELSTYLGIYRSEQGALSERLQRLFGNPDAPGPTELRITLLLPFGAARTDTTIDRISRVALQIYEGMRLALEREVYPFVKEVKLQVLDSEDNSLVIEKLVREQVLPFQPHLVIGDVRNRASQAIAEGLSESSIPQIIPLADADELLRPSRPVFLANPSAATCTRLQAHYAVKEMGITTFAVIYEPTTLSAALADTFVQAVTRLGGTCRKTLLPLDVTEARGAVGRVSAALEAVPVGAAFLPILDQELVSLTLYQFSRDSIPLNQVFGMERWRSFRSMDQELLHSFRTIVPDAYEPGFDPTGYQQFANAYFRKFGAPPTPFAAQGYDIMRLVLEVFSGPHSSEGFPAALARLPRFSGLSQAFYFDTYQTNQSVQLLRFTPTGVERLPSGKTPEDK